jgi:nucleoside-diphosphate-sugar epimerase
MLTVLAGVQGIAHLAAPVSLKFTDPEPVINTAVSATRGILESAVKESSVQSVILMSSIAAVQSQREGPYVFTEKDWNDQILDLLAQFGKGLPALGIYAASKVAAEKAFWKFRDDQKPAFAMTAVAPVFVSGPPLVVPRSSSAINEPIMHIWQIISGQEIPPPPAGFSWYVDVRDVADLVVYGVENQDKAGGERYIAAAHFGPPQAAADVLRGAYPEKAEVIKDGNPGEGYEPGFKVPGEQSIDGSKAMKALGRSYRPYEETIVDTAKVLEKVSKE